MLFLFSIVSAAVDDERGGDDDVKSSHFYLYSTFRNNRSWPFPFEADGFPMQVYMKKRSKS